MRITSHAQGLLKRTLPLAAMMILVMGASLSLMAQDTPVAQHNCRLWGIIAESAPTAAIQDQLINLPNALKNLSPANPDGWALAYFTGGSSVPTIIRGYPPAYTDPNYDVAVGVVAQATPRLAVGHVRNTSSGITPLSGDPHPFERVKIGKHWLMAHNGSIDKNILINLIRPAYLAANPVQYGNVVTAWDDVIDTDLYFIFVLQTLEDFNWQVKPALAYVVRRLRDAIPNGSERLNFYLTDGTTLWAYKEGSAVYTLYYLYNTTGTPYSAIASQYPSATQGNWVALTNGQIATLKQVGPPVVETIDDYFGGALLIDHNFDNNASSADLRNPGGWYESRGQDAALLILNTADIGGNGSNKAAFTASSTTNAYLSQQFSTPSTTTFSLSWDIYVDNILDNGTMDRAALQLVGQDLDGINGPNSTSTERFVFMGFYTDGGATTGTMSLIAREPGDTYGTSSEWLPVATGLTLDSWHTIQVNGDLGSDTYDVYVDGALARAGVQAFTPMAQVTHISFGQWNDGTGAFYVDNVYEGHSLTTWTLGMAVDPAGGGTTDPTIGDHSLADGEVVTVTAYPSSGFRFDFWTGNVTDPGAASTTVTMNQNQTVTAHFSLLPLAFLADNDFNASLSSENLRTNSTGQDWYESRADNPLLLTLDNLDVGGNATAKAAFAASNTTNAYLSQEFGTPQTGTFGVQWDIYIDQLLDRSGPDYSGWMMIGDDADGLRGPNSTGGDRFIYLAFEKDGGGTDGTMDLVAREPGAAWDAFTTLVTGLNLDQWYTVGVVCNVAGGTYDVYVNGNLASAAIPAFTSKAALTHISFAQWNDGSGTFYVDNVGQAHVLTLAVDPPAGGATDPSEGVHLYAEGAAVSIEAIAASGYEFDNWEGNVANPSLPSTTVDLDGNESVTAHFSLIPVGLVADGQFDTSIDSDDLRANGTGQDWYESRGQYPSLLTLNSGDIGGNSGPKAAFAASSAYNAYLSQEFTAPVTTTFSISWDIYVDNILDNSTGDRAAFQLVGQEIDGINGPNSTSTERFVFLAFWAEGGATTGPMSLIAREPGDTYNTSSAWALVAGGLAMDAWHTIRVNGDLTTDLYDVYVDGVLARSGIQAYAPMTQVTHISFAQWNDGSGAFYADNIHEVLAVNHTLTMAADPVGGGTTNPVIGAHSFPEGESVAIDAVAAAGYEFDHWTGPVADPFASSTSIVMDADHLVTAYFLPVPGGLLADNEFDASTGSEDLRTDGAGQDWYESRGDNPLLLTLNTDNISGNTTPKAGFTGSPVANAYLTQEFASAQTATFAVEWDIFIQEILDISSPDRAGWMLIGDNSNATRPGPNSDPSERFVQMAFYRNGGGTSGTMDLVARERNAAFTEFTTVASGLSIGQWYTVKVVCDINAGSYEIYVDGVYLATMTSYSVKSSVTHISFAQWNDGAGTFYVDNVQETAIPPRFTLTIDADPVGSAVTSPSAGTHDYPQGATVQIAATPISGYEFDFWTGAVADPGSPTTTVVMSSDQQVTVHCTEVPVVFLTDNGFDAATDTDDLRANGAGQDWYESRGDVPTLLSLNTTDVGGNTGAKAAFTGSASGNAYLSQEFGTPQSGVFAVQWEIYVQEILNISDPDRAGWMLIGDESNATRPGPNSDPSERFVQMAFFRDGGGTSGTMDLVARERGASFTQFTTVASGLTIGQWYTVKVVCDLNADSYDVYLNGEYKARMSSYTEKTSVTHISFAQWNDGAGTFYVDNVIQSSLPASYALTMASNPAAGGATNPPAGTTYYPEGSRVSISALASHGYAFTSWTGEVENPAASATSVLMNSDKSVTANFIEGSGSLHGLVRTGSTALLGVYVDLLDSDGGLVMRVISDVNGYYSMLDLPADDYVLHPQMPMGFGASGTPNIPVAVVGSDLEVNIDLVVTASGSVKDYWLWKRDITAIRDGVLDPHGFTRADVDAYCQKIFDAYYSRLDGHQIRIENVTYTGSPARALTCDDLIYLLVTLADDSNLGKARKHLLACMLNISSNRLSQLAVVTSDGATASQAIRYFSDQYLAGAANVWTFWSNVSKIHQRQIIAAGVVALSTPNVMYGGFGEVSRPPVIACPSEPLIATICGPGIGCVPLAIQNCRTVVVDPATATWSGGQLCFDVTSPGAQTFHVTGYPNDAAFDPVTCDLTVNVNFTPLPVITCPTDTIDLFACDPGQMCFGLSVTNYTAVTVVGATWSADRLCFSADTSGIYAYRVSATNGCSTVDCDVVARVSLGVPVLVSCPADTVRMHLCSAGEVCVPLEISNATGVATEGATWHDNTLCLSADTAGLYTPSVIAINACDTVMCRVVVRVIFDPAVTISCPSDTVDIVTCYPATLHVALPILNQTQVDVTGATWSGNQLSFDADTSGIYSYLVTASNLCGSSACPVVSRVQMGPAVDLYLANEDITVSNPGALPGETVTLSAVVHSDARSVPAADIMVRFFDGDPVSGGIQIEVDQTIAALSGGQSDTARVQYVVAEPVPRNIYVLIDPDGLIAECAEDNNAAMLKIEGAPPSAFVNGTVAIGAAPVEGVVVNLLDSDGGEYLSAITNASGYYRIEAIPAGSYIVDLIVPLGFGPTSPSSVPITLTGVGLQVDFVLSDVSSGSVKDYWLWKKEFRAIRDGTPLYNGPTRADVERYCAAIFDHFYDRTDGYAIRIEGVTSIGSPARALTFNDVAAIYLDIADESNAAKTRKHLLICLLNIASARLSQRAVVSTDGATASQAITYFAGRYVGGAGNDWTLWYNLTRIHTRVMIAAGVIPLSTANIVYRPEGDDSDGSLPSAFTLSQNYPNPFNPVTAIAFTLPQAANVKLEVYNVTGQLVDQILNGLMPTGSHTIRWEAGSRSSGVYVYRLTAGGFVQARKMVLLK